jgi:hypothetical protein
MMLRLRLREQVLDGAMRADGKVEEDAVTTAAGMLSRGGGAVDDATTGGGADDAKLGGPAQDLSNFQTTPIPILSVLTCSTS